MRYRVTFLAGFAAGFVAGAAAGRERYEQLVKLGRRAASHPAVQRATQTAGAKAGQLGKAATQKAAERVPKLAGTARTSASRARERIGGQRSDGSEAPGVNGAAPG
jgi:hypothetical protein